MITPVLVIMTILKMTLMMMIMMIMMMTMMMIMMGRNMITFAYSWGKGVVRKKCKFVRLGVRCWEEACVLCACRQGGTIED